MIDDNAKPIEEHDADCYVLVVARHYSQVEHECDTLESAIGMARYGNDYLSHYPLCVWKAGELVLDHDALLKRIED